VGPPLGRSDHHILSCEVNSCSPIRRRRRLIFSKARASKLLIEMTKSDEMPKLLSLPPIDFFRKVSGRLASHALIIYEPRCKSFFHAIAIYSRSGASFSQSWLDQSNVRRAILRCRGAEFVELMERLNSLKHSNEMRQFHAIIASLLHLRRKQAFAIQEIEDPLNPGTINSPQPREDQAHNLWKVPLFVLVGRG